MRKMLRSMKGNNYRQKTMYNRARCSTPQSCLRRLKLTFIMSTTSRIAVGAMHAFVEAVGSHRIIRWNPDIEQS